MGYYKWRKILTILMIISICFTLFSKISKVYATDELPDMGSLTTFTINGNDYDFHVKYLTDNFRYWFIYCGNISNNRYYQINVVGFNVLPVIRYRTYGSDYEYNYGFYYGFTEEDYDTNYFYRFATYNCLNYDLVETYWNSTYFNTSDLITDNYGASYFYSDYCGIYQRKAYNQTYQTFQILDSNFIIVNEENGDDIFYPSNMKPPELANNLENLADLSDDGFSVNAWDFSNINFYLLIYDNTLIHNDYDYVLNPAREILINKNSSYYQPTLTSDPDTNAIYFIPITDSRFTVC